MITLLLSSNCYCHSSSLGTEVEGQGACLQGHQRGMSEVRPAARTWRGGLAHAELLWGPWGRGEPRVAGPEAAQGAGCA